MPLTETDRARIEQIISDDPFAAAMPEMAASLRTDDLVAVLFLHARHGAGCRCGKGLGESHPEHVAEMIRQAGAS